MESVLSVGTTAQVSVLQDALKESDNKSAKALQSAEPKVEKQKQETAVKADVVLDSNAEAAPVPQLDSRFSLKFETDRELNIIVAKIVDKKTGDTVSQIPPEQMFKTMKYLRENPGRLLDQQA